MSKFMNDDECMQEITITVFPPMEGIGIFEDQELDDEIESCGDSMVTPLVPAQYSSDDIIINIESRNSMMKINALLEKAKSRFGEKICVRIAAYDSAERTDEAVEWLNAALRGSGSSTVLDRRAFSAFLGISAPILVINNRLSFVGIVPNEDQFLSRITASLKFPTS